MLSFINLDSISLRKRKRKLKNIKIIKFVCSCRSEYVSRFFALTLFWTQVGRLIIIPLVLRKWWLILLSTDSDYSARWTVWCLSPLSAIVPTVVCLVRCWAWDNVTVAWENFSVGGNSTLWALIALLGWIVLWRYVPSFSCSKVLRGVSVLWYPCPLWHQWSIR